MAVARSTDCRELGNNWLARGLNGDIYFLHGAESFWRCSLILSQARHFSHLMDPEGSLPYSQKPTNCPCLEPDQSSPCFPSHFLKIQLPIYVWIFQVVSFPQVSPPKLYIHLISPHTSYMPRPSHYFRFAHPNNIG